MQLPARLCAAAGGLAAPHLLQHVGAPAPGRLDLQDLGAPLLGPLLGHNLSLEQHNSAIYPGPLLPERFQPPFEALGVHASYV